MDSPLGAAVFGDPQQRLLRGIPAFAALPKAAREALASKLGEETFGQGATVIDEGEPADRVFLIDEGEVEVSISTAEGWAPLSRLSDGELFGEVGLFMPGRRRTARVTATKPLSVSTLRGRDLLRALDPYPEAKAVLTEAAEQALVRSFVKRTRPFEKLNMERLREFALRFKEIDVAAGATLFSQGDSGDACFLVRSGSLQVLRDEQGSTREVDVLEPGDIVGESALLSSTPRDATIRAIGESTLLALHRNDFIAAIDEDKRIAGHMVNLLRYRDRPLKKERVTIQPRPTQGGGTIWVLADPDRFGTYHQLSSLGLFAWKLLDGKHSIDEIAERHRAERGAVDADEIARLVAQISEAGFASAKTLDSTAAEAVQEKPASPWRRLMRALFGPQA